MRKILTFIIAFVLIFLQFSIGFAIDNGNNVNQNSTAEVNSLQLAPIPPMGWNSWNKFGGNINEDLIKEIADAMVASGMKDAGYEYINIDDGWMAPQRDANGNLQPDPKKFPHGIKAIADYVHSKGLKLGIYVSNGTNTCMGLPSSLLHEDQDAKTFADWGVDYVKYDFCYNNLVSQYAPNIDKIEITSTNDVTVYNATYEAESPDNTISGEAKIADLSTASNGKVVGYIGNNSGILQFNKITVPDNGTYKLKIYYVNEDLNRRIAYISVNGAEGVKYFFPGKEKDWSSIQTVETNVDLKKGENTIKIYNPLSSNQDRAKEQYSWMSDALKKTGRPIVFSICEWGTNQPWLWGKDIGQLWRTTGDISDNWNSMVSNMDKNSVLSQYAGPNHWNDPDMLEVGNGGMTDVEYKSHFSLWAIMAAPLITGNDLRNMSDETKAILLNKDVISIDQDPLGIQGRVLKNDNGKEIFVKPLANGDVAVLLFNRTSNSLSISTNAQEIGMESSEAYKIRDLWQHTDMLTPGNISATIPPHGVAMYRVSKATGNEDISPFVDISFSNNQIVEPEQSGKLTAVITNYGSDIRNVKIDLTYPNGWTFSNELPTNFDKITTNQSVYASWNFQVPINADYGWNDIKARVTYIYGNDYNGEQNADTQIYVHEPTSGNDSYLSDMNWIDASNGWGSIGLDKTVGKNPIKLKNVIYDKGLGVHAPSTIEYYIGGKYTKFHAIAGIDDEAINNNPMPVEFQVYGDDKMLWDSGIMSDKSDPKVVDVDITGINILKLIVNQVSDTNTWDHTDWADAKILNNGIKIDNVTADTIDAGKSGNINVMITNVGSSIAKNVQSSLIVPDGWTVTPITSTSFDNISIGQSVNVLWTVYRPAEYDSNGYTNIGIRTSFTYDDNNNQFLRVVKVATPPSPPNGDTYLSDIQWRTMSNYWGPAEKDMSNGEQGAGDGNPITINGVVYKKGLGVHAPSTIEYTLGGKFNRFISDVGIDDEIIYKNDGTHGTPAAVIFEVYGDNNLIYTSGVMHMMESKHIDVDISGVNILKLVVRPGVEGTNSDHADWANAMIKMNSTQARIEVNPNNVTLDVGETAKANAIVYDQNGQIISGTTITWSSDDPTIATVCQKGYIKGISEGSTVIRATYGTLSAIVNVTVKNVSGVVTTLKGPNFVNVGQQYTVTFGLNNAKDITAQGLVVNYDSNVLDFVEAKSVDETKIQVLSTDTNTPGVVKIILASLGGQSALNGNTDILNITFKAKAESHSTDINIEKAELSDSQGNEVSAVLTMKSISVTPEGDLNGDGKVTIADLGILAKYYGTTASDSNWNEIKIADYDNSDKIDLYDLVFIAKKVNDNL